MSTEQTVRTIIQRMEAAGLVSPGDFTTVADVIAIAAAEADHWTGRWDDAIRIPDMLGDIAGALHKRAQDLVSASFTVSTGHPKLSRE